MEKNKKNIVFVRDDLDGRLTNMLFHLRKGSHITLKCIELIKMYYQFNLYNHNVWALTGPGIINVFFEDNEFKKLLFSEYFDNGYGSTFKRTITSSTESWSYQQHFGVYNRNLELVKYNGAKLLKSLDYCIKIGMESEVNKIIKHNRGNLNHHFQSHILKTMSDESLLLCYSENKEPKILEKIIINVDCTVRSEIKNILSNNALSANFLRDLSIKKEENDDNITAYHLMKFASYFRKGTFIIGKLNELKKIIKGQ